MNKIKEKLISAHNSNGNLSRKQWTDEFLRKLAEVGDNKGYAIYPAKYNATQNNKDGEWLFDLCWSIEGKGKGWMKNWEGLKLICECEWNTTKEEILYDFQKLAVAKAEIKLMIVQYNDNGKNPFKTIKEWCEASVAEELYKDGSDYYLFGSSNDAGNNGYQCEKLWS